MDRKLIMFKEIIREIPDNYKNKFNNCINCGQKSIIITQFNGNEVEKLIKDIIRRENYK